MHRFTVGDHLFTDNQGHNAANYFKEKDVTDQGGKWLNWLQSILGRFSTEFRKLKILSKHLLPQFRMRDFSKNKSHSSLGTMEVRFPMGEPVRGHGSYVADLAPHWIFRVGTGLHFPRVGQFPIEKPIKHLWLIVYLWSLSVLPGSP